MRKRDSRGLVGGSRCHGRSWVDGTQVRAAGYDPRPRLSSFWFNAGLVAENRIPRGAAESHVVNSLSVIVYRSRAVVPASDVDLFYLLAQARERNEIEGVTGLLLYDRGHFYQWIEGDEQSLHRVWNSIRMDRRHTDIEVLADRTIPFRLFTRWSMQFAHRDRQFVRFMDGFAAAHPLLLDDLHAAPEAAPRILASFGRLDHGRSSFPGDGRP